MSDTITGQVWSLDTVVGVVTTAPVCIHGIYVRFTTAGAGSFQMLTNITNVESSTGKPLIDCASTATATANAFQCTQFFTLGDQFFQGLKKTLSVNVETVWLVTSSGR